MFTVSLEAVRVRMSVLTVYFLLCANCGAIFLPVVNKLEGGWGAVWWLAEGSWRVTILVDYLCVSSFSSQLDSNKRHKDYIYVPVEWRMYETVVLVI